mgnify:CR=1 FL=1
MSAIAERENAAENETNPVYMPAKFPARFSEFLRAIVGCRTSGDSLARFRHYLCYHLKTDVTPGLSDEEALTKAVMLIAGMKSNGITNKVAWFGMAKRYQRWWIASVKLKRAKAAKGHFKKISD